MNNFFGQRQNFSPMSNKIVVQSLEDALRRFADFDSDMVYWDANQNLMYNVYTNVRGEKSFEIYEFKKVEPIKPKQETDGSLQLIMDKLNELNNKVEELYGKYDVKQTGQTGQSTGSANYERASSNDGSSAISEQPSVS